MNWGNIADWLSPIVSTILGAVAGYAAARAQERRQRSDRLRGIAAALAADLRRIQLLLGEPSDQYSEISVGNVAKAAPQLHEWTRSLIVEAGQISPQIIAEFMDLERQLTNFGTNVDALRKTTNEVHRLQHELSNAEEQRIAGVVHSVNIRRVLDQAQTTAELFHNGAVAMRQDAWATMQRIEQQLTPILPRTPNQVLQPAPSESDPVMLGSGAARRR
jgi:hypothetical protein